MTRWDKIGTERLVITLTSNGKVAVTCDHCGMNELIDGDSASTFVRGRIAAHVGLMVTVAQELR
jgi:hypothetical protein